MMCQIDDKKVYVFVAMDIDSGGYDVRSANGGEWIVLIVEEGASTTNMVYQDAFKTREDAVAACEIEFSKIYGKHNWNGCLQELNRKYGAF